MLTARPARCRHRDAQIIRARGLEVLVHIAARIHDDRQPFAASEQVSAAASQEQSSGIEQINLAITQMDEVTQQNAALVEEAAAAAQSMQEQAERLAAAVAQFKLAPSSAVRAGAPGRLGKPPSRLALAG